jgi:hypothetical protein
MLGYCDFLDLESLPDECLHLFQPRRIRNNIGSKQYLLY